MINATRDWTKFIWAGYWNNDHHVWLNTEFGELADYTIKYWHLLAARTAPNFLPLPTIWYKGPPMRLFMYLMDGLIDENLQSADPEWEQTSQVPLVAADELKTRCDLAASRRDSHRSFRSPESLEHLITNRDPWAYAVQKALHAGNGWPPELEAEISYRLRLH